MFGAWCLRECPWTIVANEVLEGKRSIRRRQEKTRVHAANSKRDAAHAAARATERDAGYAAARAAGRDAAYAAAREVLPPPRCAARDAAAAAAGATRTDVAEARASFRV